MTLNPWRAGVALGVFLGAWHLAWSLMVAVGWAEAILRFILRIHFIDLEIGMSPFDVGLAATLVAVTTAIGFILGALFALLWNSAHGISGSGKTPSP